MQGSEDLAELHKGEESLGQDGEELAELHGGEESIVQGSDGLAGLHGGGGSPTELQEGVESLACWLGSWWSVRLVGRWRQCSRRPGGYLQNLRQLSPLLTSNLSCIFIYRICGFFLNNLRHFSPKKFAAKLEVNSGRTKIQFL